jgi:3-hydroxybutyryl-CoA dehydrogenase
MKACAIAIESITESLEMKRDAYGRAEEVLRPTAIIGSNTSAIPVSLLQKGAKHPARFVGIHWDEPAHVTRFMEVIAGEQTSPKYARRVMQLAVSWGKEPSLLRRDVPGFITNRISYAMFREACHLVDSGVATVEDVDRSLRNDVGWWMPFAGPFRYMDLMGVQSYVRVMKQLAPKLSTEKGLPALMRKMEEKQANGISTGEGFYKYTPEESKRWEELYLKFNYDVRRLAMKYPASLAKPRDRGEKKPNADRRRTSGT